MKNKLLLLALILSVGTIWAQNNNESGTISFTSQSFPTNGNFRAVVDMNGDYLDDIVSIQATNINIFYQQIGGGFNEVDITTTSANYLPSWSLAAADYDKNGYTDLLYGSGNGVTFMRANATGTGYTEISGTEYVFSQRSNFVDINNDGNLDAFVCHDVEPNVYYINDGSGNLGFVQGGLGDYATGGNYGSIWVDYDGDGDVDLFIAKCGGEPARRTNQMHRNNGDGTFTEVADALGLADIMQTWSSAWGDFDNDGDMDVFVGASTGTHKLMRNNGDQTFTNVTAASGVLALSETGIENTTHDIDNDGYLDIISNGNVLMGNGDLTFTTIHNNMLPGNNGGIGDLNDDGFLDAFSGNTIHYSNGNANNWIKINTQGTVSNGNGIGARVILETPAGTQIRDVRAGEGFGYMSSLNTHFGIGTETVINSITIVWPSGIVNIVTDPAPNTTITIVEEEILGIEENLLTDLIVYPNPTDGILNLNSQYGLEDAFYIIYDTTGKRITSSNLSSKTIDVSGLSSGTYILRIIDDGTLKTQRFIKK
ncbi:FG-GAP-like repeat-containing protein [Constantimarinum furrinae]|uniref:FG-GAP-like repeat-containing protein n=1 Tax=Constantimarinum furrinae TaxID=2562285 RepID=UPI00164C0C03|nr:FG-GAP-like repeat-containing protein [Constantimarinum furrinae]